MNKYYIGIMTGTSADAIDGCVVSFDGNFNLIASGSVNHERGYKENYEECIVQGVKEVHRSKKLEKLEYDLNKKSLQLIENLLNESKLSYKDEIAIGFSGQTVFHSKEKSYQIGDPQFIANSSNIKVISDFRNFDIAQGGSGAPLIPAFHKYLYSEKEKEKIIFNIGGIANGTYLKGNEISLASDVGPGNCLIDKIANKGDVIFFDQSSDDVQLTSISEEGSYLVLAGKPLNEPVARYGPFVANSEGEIKKAMTDYQDGKMGTLA